MDKAHDARARAIHPPHHPLYSHLIGVETKPHFLSKHTMRCVPPRNLFCSHTRALCYFCRRVVDGDAEGSRADNR